MKNIKYFKYVNTKHFNTFLDSYCYHLDDVKGFSFAGKRQYNGNILKIYNIRFNDGEYEYFKVIYFKNFNEYRQARLGFSCIKLSSWCESADIRLYKRNDGYVIA